MADSDAGRLSEEIFSFTFRNKGSIRIPKGKREIAYIQAVDIFIDSISYTAYKSSKTEPDESFYGYATLVFQDALSDKIPLRFGRNRIYQARNEQALNQWEFHRQFYATKSYIDSYYRLLTEPDAPIPPFNPPNPLFVELPLRELYVECQVNTQFQIEYTQWQPIPYTNDNSISFDGKSQQEDGDKDGGLPANGVQPRQNPPSNPFRGGNPPSNSSTLGDFFNPKFGTDGSLSSLNDEGESGLDPNTPLRYSLGFIYYSYSQGCSNPRYIFYVELGRYDDPPIGELGSVTSTYTSCNGEQGGLYSISVNGSVVSASANSLLAGRGFLTIPFYDESELNGVYFPNGRVDE